MSDPGTGRVPARPRQVTVAGVMAAVACLLLVVSLFDSMTQIRSSDTDRTVRDFLASAPGQSLGLGADAVVRILRVVVLLSGALAAAGVILSIYSLRRHRGARVGLSVVAILMLFSTTLVAGLLPFVVLLGAGMLWRQEARDWFDGRPPRPRIPATQASAHQQPPTLPSAGPDRASPPQRPAAGAFGGSFGSPPPGPYPVHPGYPGHPGWQQQPVYGTPPAGRRPGAVTAAAWLTWVFAGLATMLFGLMILSLLLQRAQLIDGIQRNPGLAAQGLSAQEWLSVLWVVSAVGIFWSLSAMALAVLAYNRVRLGQVGLALSAGIAGVVGVITLVGFLNGLAAFVTLALLLRGDTNRWFGGHQTAPAWPGAGWPGGGGYGGPGSGPGASAWPPPADREQDRPQQDRPEQDRPEQDWPEQDRPEGRPKADPRTTGPSRIGLSTTRHPRRASRRSGSQAPRSAACRRPRASSRTGVSLQNAHRTRCRPASTSS